MQHASVQHRATVNTSPTLAGLTAENYPSARTFVIKCPRLSNRRGLCEEDGMRSTTLFFVLLVLSGCAHHSHVHNSGNPNMQTGISVSGSGEAKAKPDVARANLGVEVRAATVEQASAEANTRMAAVMNALKQAGIADKDLRTHNYSINFEQEPTPPPVPLPAPVPAPARTKDKVSVESTPVPPPAAPSIRGFYRVSNMVEVTIRDLAKVGQVLARATEAGSNNVWGISFELDDPYAMRAQARQQAMERAQKSATDLAKLAGVTLGDVIAVSESEGGGYVPMMKSMRGGMEMAQANDVPVEQGEITITHQVQLTYELDRDDD